LFVDEKNSKQADLYAIGLQEVVDLNTQSFLLQADWAQREEVTFLLARSQNYFKD
jgi:hypothetical protein